MTSKGGFRAGRGYVDQIFTLKQIGEKAQEKKQSAGTENMMWMVNC